MTRLISTNFSDLLKIKTDKKTNTRPFPGEVLRFDSLPSTNTELKKLASEGALPGTVVSARAQTDGRGRSGKTFLSPAGGVYLSYLYRPDEISDRITGITALTALAAADAVKSLYGIVPEIKWPNDLLLNGGKICGILTESVVSDGKMCIIVGIGMNVNTPEFPRELNGIASSLRLSLGRTFSTEAVENRLIENLDDLFSSRELFTAGRYAEYGRYCINIGKKCTLRCNGTEEVVTVTRVNEDYSLSAVCGDGSEKRIFYGEVTLRAEQ